MKTIDNLNITSLSVRNKSEVMGSTKDYKARLNLNLSKEMNDKLQRISEDLNANVTEIIRQVINSIISNCEDLANENN